MAVDADLDHAGAGIALGDNLAQPALKLVHLIADLRQVFHQTGDLTDFLEHVRHP